MANIRVYELAKELGLDSKTILGACKELGFENKKSHSNSLTSSEADNLRRKFGNATLEKEEVKSSEEEPTKEDAGGESSGSVRRGNVIRRSKSESDSSSDSSLVIRRRTSKKAPPVEVEEEVAEIKEEISNEVETSKEEPLESKDSLKEESSEEETLSDAEQEPKEKIEEEVKEVKKPSRFIGKIELPKARKPVEPVASESRSSKLKKKDKKARKGDSSDDSMRGESGGRKRSRRQVLKSGDLLDYDSHRDPWNTRKRKKKSKDPESSPESAAPRKASKMVVKIEGDTITVGDLAKSLEVKSGELIKKLMGLGLMANINQAIDFETATIVADDFGFTTQKVGVEETDYFESLRVGIEEGTQLRPPVVTVMGHVDHGKTSLLDAIRSEDVADGEAGGITQHIGAYIVNLERGERVCFLDTPGHEAFTAMRSRGAQVTDVVILVVAADDGVMPQTIEAINHAKAADVPIIVAINKMDKDGANPDVVKSQLSENGLISEDWGGDTMMIPVSAHSKEGIDTLLESVMLQAEVLELKANPDTAASGVVVESCLDRSRGSVMTVLVKNGTLKRSDSFIVGSVHGRVRALINNKGETVDEAGPSIPVEVLGASATASVGDDFFVVKSESDAKKIAEKVAHKERTQELVSRNGSAAAPLTLESLSEYAEQQEMKEIPLVVKADVQGSLEAISESLLKLSNEEVETKIIHKAVGGVTENDVSLAFATGAIIIAFNVRPDTTAANHIERDSVEVVYSRVIYEIVETIESALKGKLKPIQKEVTLGRVEVRETFRVPKLGVVAGSYVLDGKIERGSSLRLLRDNKVVYEGKMASLRRFKDDVAEVAAGYECGVGIEGYSDIQTGDIIEAYKIKEIAHV